LGDDKGGNCERQQLAADRISPPDKFRCDHFGNSPDWAWVSVTRTPDTVSMNVGTEWLAAGLWATKFSPIPSLASAIRLAKLPQKL
jgi:hypothetical protein